MTKLEAYKKKIQMMVNLERVAKVEIPITMIVKEILALAARKGLILVSLKVEVVREIVMILGEECPNILASGPELVQE
jgi:hypothetical protein